MADKRRARPATLRTIADHVGVHVTTVSKVLNGSDAVARQAASTDTVERIREAATKLGYRPNPHATSLRTSRSNLIGVLVPRLSDIVLATIYEGIEARANELGLSTFVTNSYDVPDNQRARTTMMLNRRVDGLIFGDARYDAAFVDSVAAQNVPFVLVSRHAGAHPSVTCDDFRGGWLAGQHLAELGHRDVAVAAGADYASTAIDRTAGFVAAMKEYGVRVTRSQIVYTSFDAAGGRAAGAKIVARKRRPTAIFATNDFAAIGVMGAIQAAGLRPVEDISVVGYNDTPLAANIVPPLTTVRSPMFEMGQQAVSLLSAILAGEDVADTQIRLAPELIVRETARAPD